MTEIEELKGRIALLEGDVELGHKKYDERGKLMWLLIDMLDQCPNDFSAVWSSVKEEPPELTAARADLPPEKAASAREE